MQQFRLKFQNIPKDLYQWFPGHMNKGLKQMQQKLKTVDCIIEVQDARIPFSSRNDEFRHTIGGTQKPHILVYNKKDLITRKHQSLIADRMKAEDTSIQHMLFTNCKDQQCDGVKKLLPLAQELIVNSNRYNRSMEEDHAVMIIGVPNVGKSSLINTLRNRNLKKKNASAVGGIPGITRSVLNRIKICEDPLMYLLDTPGILAPNIKDAETGLKLALCACLQDHQVGEDIIADYLLFYLNKIGNHKYVEFMGLEEPTDEIAEVLIAGAMKLEKTIRLRNHEGAIVVRPNTQIAAQHMIKHFRTGGFGKLLLDYS
jgi:mitochondrial GTPase 1